MELITQNNDSKEVGDGSCMYQNVPEDLNFIENRFQHREFPVNITKFVGRPFPKKTSGPLPLKYIRDLPDIVCITYMGKVHISMVFTA